MIWLILLVLPVLSVIALTVWSYRVGRRLPQSA